MTNVSLLTHPEQLENGALFQLGSTSEPCRVLFATSTFDKEKKWKAVRIIVPTAELAVLEQHALSPVKQSPYEDEVMVTVKVCDTTTVEDSSGKKLSVSDLTSGVQCMLVVKAYHWSWKQGNGIALQAQAIRLFGKAQTIGTVYGFL